MTEEVEDLLAQALVPVEPPLQLRGDLTSRLQAITESAQEELDGWEISAMRNPRNWVRPVAAAFVGTAAGTALIVIQVRATHRQRVNDGEALPLLELAGRTVRGIGAGVRRATGGEGRIGQLGQSISQTAGGLELPRRFESARRSVTRR